MIAEILNGLYDYSGTRTGAPSSRKRRKLFFGTFPMGRYISQPLSIQCKNLKEMRKFLVRCKYVSDMEQFNRKDYWMPPEEFEQRKQGDCDDFALWTWRQLMDMGYKSRYVVGRAGKYGEGHAWVTIEKKGKHFLVEPLMTCVGRLPRLSVGRYEPEGSVEWDGKNLHYFKHKKPEYKLPILKIPELVSEWILLQLYFFLPMFFYILFFPFYFIRHLIRKHL